LTSSGQAGFDKSRRLLKAAQFRKVLREGRKCRNTLFLLACQATGQAAPRLGITVSKKVSKRAVVRNRIKRQVREYFRLHQNEMPAQDFVVIAHPPAANTEHNTLTQELANTWKKTTGTGKAR